MPCVSFSGKTIVSTTKFETVPGQPHKSHFQWAVKFEVGVSDHAVSFTNDLSQFNVCFIASGLGAIVGG